MLDLAIKNAAEQLPESVLTNYMGEQARADGSWCISNYAARTTAITNLFSSGLSPEQVCQVCFFLTHSFMYAYPSLPFSPEMGHV
jgi:hypothetical protein